jgi:hypothetical protein
MRDDKHPHNPINGAVRAPSGSTNGRKLTQMVKKAAAKGQETVRSVKEE